MTSCPKCGSTRISGPSYVRNGYGAERLNYHCDRCGFRDSTPCNDARQPGTGTHEALFQAIEEAKR